MSFESRINIITYYNTNYTSLYHISQCYNIQHELLWLSSSFFNTRMRICSPGMVDRALLQFMKREPLPPARPLRKPSKKSTWIAGKAHWAVDQTFHFGHIVRYVSTKYIKIHQNTRRKMKEVEVKTHLCHPMPSYDPLRKPRRIKF